MTQMPQSGSSPSSFSDSISSKLFQTPPAPLAWQPQLDPCWELALAPFHLQYPAIPFHPKSIAIAVPSCDNSPPLTWGHDTYLNQFSVRYRRTLLLVLII